MNKALLLDLHQHTLEVKVWNAKDKLSARARFDRPKAFRLPAPGRKRKPPGCGELEVEDNKEQLGVEENQNGECLANTGRPVRLPLVHNSSARRSKVTKKQSKLSKLHLDAAGTSEDDLSASVGEVTSPVPPPVPEEGGTRGGENHNITGRSPPIGSSSLVPYSTRPNLSSSLPASILTGV